jgi:hypothetical protein
LLNQNNDESKVILNTNLSLLKNEIGSELNVFNDLPKISTDIFSSDKFNADMAKESRGYLDKLENKYILLFNAVSKKKDDLIKSIQEKKSGKEVYLKFFDNYYNDCLADIVKKTSAKNKIIREEDHLIQNCEPIFLNPSSGKAFSLRAHFFAPVKYIFNMPIDTLLFNLIIIWLMIVFFYVTLYFDVLKKIIDYGSRKRNNN